jgi:hypothetical protein
LAGVRRVDSEKEISPLEECVSGLLRSLKDWEGEWKGWYGMEGFERGGY